MFSSRSALSTFLVAVLGALLAGPAGATTMDTLSTEELTYVADLVAEAVVETNSVERVEGSRFLRTVTRVRLEHVLKGDQLEGEQVDVLVLGGSLDGEETHIASAPIFAPGERVLVFLELRRGEWRVVGLSQGKLTLIHEEDTARDLVVRVQPPRGLAKFEEAAVQLPAQRSYADDLITKVATDVAQGNVPAYRSIPGLPVEKDTRFRLEATAQGQHIDPRWAELDSSKGGRR